MLQAVLIQVQSCCNAIITNTWWRTCCSASSDRVSQLVSWWLVLV